MRERAVSFGRGAGLLGIVSEPKVTPAVARPFVVILNSGLLHKVGPFRLSVDLARKLAGDGFSVMRFDLSGLGDSKMRIAPKEGDDLPVADVREAMDFLEEQFGARTFVLAGLCSGSDNSHRASVVDERVVGAVHLDGVGYKTPRYFVNHYARRLTSARFLKQKLDRARAKRSPQAPIAGINAYNRKFPPMEQVGRELTQLVVRGVKLLYVYTGGVEQYTNYRDQLRDTFSNVDFGDRLTLDFFPHAEHTFPLVRTRRDVVDRIADWMHHEFSR
jgi:hypothetical protein